MDDYNGWIKIYRKLLENPVFYKPELLQLFMYCLLKAGHKQSRIIFNGKEIVLEPGSFITGREVMASELKQKPMSTYKRLKILKNIGILNIKSNNKFSIVTIENWSLYQMDETKSNNKRNNQGTTGEQPGNTNKNDKNIKNNICSFFDALWDMYPRKKGKDRVKKESLMAINDVGYEKMVECIQRYKMEIERNNISEEYIMYGSTFFNGRYKEYMDPEKPRQTTEKEVWV